MTKREQFIQWLSDAHAMEVGIISTLEKHAADAKGLPKIRAAINKHLKETKRHAAEMKKALATFGAAPSVLKEGLSKVSSLVTGLTVSLAQDTVIKNGIADFATEHLEIACYQSLIITAKELGETKIAATCKAILKEEQAMAKVLEAELKELTPLYLQQLDTEATEEPSLVTAPPPTRRALRITKTSPKRKSTRQPSTK